MTDEMKVMSDERFWRKVDKSGDCWNYTGAKNQFGYGWVTRLNRQIYAHRYAWTVLRGQIPEGLHVLHTCDNRQCVNPSHLYLGNASANMKDRRDRGRVKTQKLNAELVQQMRAEFKAGASKSSLARAYKISTGYASEVINGKYWD